MSRFRRLSTDRRACVNRLTLLALHLPACPRSHVRVRVYPESESEYTICCPVVAMGIGHVMHTHLFDEVKCDGEAVVAQILGGPRCVPLRQLGDTQLVAAIYHDTAAQKYKGAKLSRQVLAAFRKRRDHEQQQARKVAQSAANYSSRKLLLDHFRSTCNTRGIYSLGHGCSSIVEDQLLERLIRSRQVAEQESQPGLDSDVAFVADGVSFSRCTLSSPAAVGDVGQLTFFRVVHKRPADMIRVQADALASDDVAVQLYDVVGEKDHNNWIRKPCRQIRAYTFTARHAR